MKDIDFDELDKAVNSLMATAPESPAKAADDQKPETTLDITTQPAPAVMPVASAEPVVVTTNTTPAAPVAPSAPVTPAVKRTGGRFMDMVHASSDMKPRQAVTPPSREGLSVTPRPTIETPAPAPVTPSAPAVEPTTNTAVPDTMPDPLELGGISDTPAVSEPTPALEPDNLATATTGESPFIADAKVEKRPLNPGTASAEPSFDAQMANELTDQEPAAEATDTEKTDASTDEPPAVPQVPELSSDLVAIESNAKLDEPVATQSVDTKDAAKAVSEPAVPQGATSIAKQYKTQPSTGDQSHAAIYDASQYPEPVAHPAKKKSGWLWVLWVVLLLGVGAGAAVLLYSMGIIP